MVYPLSRVAQAILLASLCGWSSQLPPYGGGVRDGVEVEVDTVSNQTPTGINEDLDPDQVKEFWWKLEGVFSDSKPDIGATGERVNVEDEGKDYIREEAKKPSCPDRGYECVPRFQCIDGNINTDGIGLIDLRLKQKPAEKPCVDPDYPDVSSECCRTPPEEDRPAVDETKCHEKHYCAAGPVCPGEEKINTDGAGLIDLRIQSVTRCYQQNKELGICCPSPLNTNLETDVTNIERGNSYGTSPGQDTVYNAGVQPDDTPNDGEGNAVSASDVEASYGGQISVDVFEIVQNSESSGTNIAGGSDSGAYANVNIEAGTEYDGGYAGVISDVSEGGQLDAVDEILSTNNDGEIIQILQIEPLSSVDGEINVDVSIGSAAGGEVYENLDAGIDSDLGIAPIQSYGGVESTIRENTDSDVNLEIVAGEAAYAQVYAEGDIDEVSQIIDDGSLIIDNSEGNIGVFGNSDVDSGVINDENLVGEIFVDGNIEQVNQILDGTFGDTAESSIGVYGGDTIGDIIVDDTVGEIIPVLVVEHVNPNDAGVNDGGYDVEFEVIPVDPSLQGSSGIVSVDVFGDAPSNINVVDVNLVSVDGSSLDLHVGDNTYNTDAASEVDVGANIEPGISSGLAYNEGTDGESTVIVNNDFISETSYNENTGGDANPVVGADTIFGEDASQNQNAYDGNIDTLDDSGVIINPELHSGDDGTNIVIDTEIPGVLGASHVDGPEGEIILDDSTSEIIQVSIIEPVPSDDRADSDGTANEDFGAINELSKDEEVTGEIYIDPSGTLVFVPIVDADMVEAAVIDSFVLSEGIETDGFLGDISAGGDVSVIEETAPEILETIDNNSGNVYVDNNPSEVNVQVEVEEYPSESGIGYVSPPLVEGNLGPSYEGEIIIDADETIEGIPSSDLGNVDSPLDNVYVGTNLEGEVIIGIDDAVGGPREDIIPDTDVVYVSPPLDNVYVVQNFEGELIIDTDDTVGGPKDNIIPDPNIVHVSPPIDYVYVGTNFEGDVIIDTDDAVGGISEDIIPDPVVSNVSPPLDNVYVGTDFTGEVIIDTDVAIGGQKEDIIPDPHVGYVSQPIDNVYVGTNFEGEFITDSDTSAEGILSDQNVANDSPPLETSYVATDLDADINTDVNDIGGAVYSEGSLDGSNVNREDDFNAASDNYQPLDVIDNSGVTYGEPSGDIDPSGINNIAQTNRDDTLNHAEIENVDQVLISESEYTGDGVVVVDHIAGNYPDEINIDGSYVQVETGVGADPNYNEGTIDVSPNAEDDGTIGEILIVSDVGVLKEDGPDGIDGTIVEIPVVSDGIDETIVEIPVVTDGIDGTFVEIAVVSEGIDGTIVEIPVVSDGIDGTIVEIPVVSDGIDGTIVEIPVVSDGIDETIVEIPVVSDGIDGTFVEIAVVSEGIDGTIVEIPVVSDGIDGTIVEIPVVSDEIDGTIVEIPVVSDGIDGTIVEIPVVSDGIDGTIVEIPDVSDGGVLTEDGPAEIDVVPEVEVGNYGEVEEIYCSLPYECVPSNLCNYGRIVSDGAGIINLRIKPKVEACTYLDDDVEVDAVCCLPEGVEVPSTGPKQPPPPLPKTCPDSSQQCVEFGTCSPEGFIITDGAGSINLRIPPKNKCSINPGLEGVCCSPAPPTPVECPIDSQCVSQSECHGTALDTFDSFAAYNSDGEWASCKLSTDSDYPSGVCCVNPSPPVLKKCPEKTKCVLPSECAGKKGYRSADQTSLGEIPASGECYLWEGENAKGICCAVEEYPVAAASRCGIRNVKLDTRITSSYSQKANETEFGELPWQAILFTANYTFICGATIVSNEHVLTGAHCVNEFSPADIRVRFGEWQVNRFDEPLSYVDGNVADIKIHPDFVSSNLHNDVAIMRLAEPIKFQYHINSLCIPEVDFKTAFKTERYGKRPKCTASGWGKDSFGGDYQQVLKKVDLPLVNKQKCQSQLRKTRLSKYFRLHKSFMCAGGKANEDSCSGDGGGPLSCYDYTTQSYVLAGITAWGIGCGQKDIPGVYVDVGSFTTWIKGAMQVSVEATKVPVERENTPLPEETTVEREKVPLPPPTYGK